MNRFFMGFSYLIFLNFELAFFLIGAVHLAKYLNVEYKRTFDWINVTVPFSLLLCCYAVYRFLVFVIKNDRKKA
jgi:hypothetical protein